ncbi:MAG: hypothetical protein ABJN24_02130 [Hyphomicrobiales bacterium]
MIEIALFSTAGFLVAALIALLALPFLTGQASRSAVHKMRENMPFTAAEMSADKDQLRAEHAVALRKLEMKIDKQAEKISAQNIELNEFNEKISATNKISKAGKLALEEIRSKEINLNDRLRKRDADYAGLEQRSRRMIRENRELKLALRKENKSLKTEDKSTTSDDDNQIKPSSKNKSTPQNEAKLSALIDKNKQANKKISDLQEQLSIALNTPGIAGSSSSKDKKAIRLPKAKLPSTLGGENARSQNTSDTDSIADLQEELLNMAAQMAHITATIEGDNSKITEILTTSDETNSGSLSSRIQALMDHSNKETPKLPKAKGLTAAKKTTKAAPKSSRASSTRARKTTKAKPTQTEKA